VAAIGNFLGNGNLGAAFGFETETVGGNVNAGRVIVIFSCPDKIDVINTNCLTACGNLFNKPSTRECYCD
jgi:hypothetical protein